MRRSRRLLVLIPAAAAAFGLAACGGGGGSASPTAVRYTSAHDLISALSHAGMPCTGALYSKSSAVQSVSSQATCSFSGAPDDIIEVSDNSVKTATVLGATVSTGPERIWSDIGPNWWVETSKPFAEKVQKLLGGKVVGGPWHPAHK